MKQEKNKKGMEQKDLSSFLATELWPFVHTPALLIPQNMRDDILKRKGKNTDNNKMK